MSKPIFLCIPGASHSPRIYEPLKAALVCYGYTIVPIALPSVGGNPPTYDFTEDVVAIRHMATHLVESGNDVIVVMHGYGGLPGGEALQGLGKREREQRGQRGGIVRLVFIMSWMAKEGFQSSPRGDVSALFPYMRPNLHVSNCILGVPSPIQPAPPNRKIDRDHHHKPQRSRLSLLQRHASPRSRILGIPDPPPEHRRILEPDDIRGVALHPFNIRAVREG